VKLARWAREYSLAVVALVVVLVGWELAVTVGRIPAFVLPAPSAIWRRFLGDLSLLRLHTLVTLQEILAGYAVAVVTGLAIAVLIVQFKTFERVVYPWVIASQTVPKIAVAPLLIIWLGSGLMPKVLIVAVTAFFPITVNAVSGFRSVDENYLNLLRSVAATPRQVFVRLRFPYALPFIFGGLKLATTLSVLGAIVAEFMGASEGLGYLILASTFNFEVARVFVALIVLVAIGVAFFGVISLAEQRLSWRRETRVDVLQTEMA
jgi:NitT/TauT family transport system permease protein